MSDLSGRIGAVCRRFGVASLYVFGSRASEIGSRLAGLEQPAEGIGVDVDIAAQPVAGSLANADSRVAFAQQLEALLGVGRVDLVILPEASAFLAGDAVRGELLYCDDEDRQAREELDYLRRVADLAPYQKARLDGILTGELRR